VLIKLLDEEMSTFSTSS
jgi:uncharacterized membrane protein YdfJ with MMPL/SSD domain